MAFQLEFGSQPYVLETPGDPGSPFLTDSLSASTYSAIIVASDSTCGGCDLNPGATADDSIAINKRAADIVNFFNSGGGLLFLAGAHHSDGSLPYRDYYKALPLPASGLPVAGPFTLTAAGKTTIGITDGSGGTSDDINCCVTHNSFALPPAGSGIQIAELDSAGQAETIFAEGTITGDVVNSCLQEISQRVLCSTDGSKEFTWSLFLRNLSASPIENILFIDLPAGVTMTPDQFNFTTPVPALVGTKQLPAITIKGAAPGSTIKFRISTSGKDFETCCAVDYTLELPECDCAQIVTDQEPNCFFPFPPPFRYKFTVDNLDSIQKTFIVLTPLPGSSGVPPDITFTPDVISGLALAPVPYSGTQGQTTQTVSISGPDATGGTKACFLISMQDETCVHCCSISKCLTLPTCGLFPWDPVDSTIFTLTPDVLFMKAGPAGGPSGAAVTLGQAATFDVKLGDLDPSGALPTGAQLRLRSTGASDTSSVQDIGSLVLTKNSSDLAITADFTPIGSLLARVEVSNNGRLEALSPQAQGPLVISGQGADLWPASLSVTNRRGEQTGYFATWANPVQITLPGVGLFTGNELRISAENLQQTPLDFLQTSTLEASGIPEIDVLGADATYDCNHNGVPDKDDIALGTSADVNRNGIPDECEGVAGDLQLSLNTGFDPLTGTVLPLGTLPEGTSDPRWQVTNVPNADAAKVVIETAPVWPAALPGSRWISVSPRRGASIPGVQRLAFQTCFCLQANAAGAEMNLQLFADDSATVLLNESQIGGPGGQFSGALPLSIHLSGAIGEGPFRAGQNCLDVEVNDLGGVVTGLDLAGTVSARGGACSAP